MRDFDLEFTESRSLGATWALDVLWNRLGIGETMRRVLADRHLDDSAERVLFALVANRALAPSPKLAARWVSEDVIISGLPATSDDACYQAMDWLPEIKDALETEVFERVTYMPNQEVDLLVFDTATYSETDQAQVVGVAVTRHGIPVRAWSWPGNTADSALIRQVREDLGASAPTRIVWVANRGFTAADLLAGGQGPVHRRGEAAVRFRRGRRGRGAVPAGPLPGSRQPAGHGDPDRLGRAVRALP